MASSFTTNKGLEKPGNGDYVDTWNVPVNADMDVIDKALGGVTSLNATGGSATLTIDQYRGLIISITGSISGPVTYTIPSGVGGSWIVRNTTTDASGGPHAVSIASAGGGLSVAVVRNVNVNIFSDGTNIRSTTTPVPGANGEIIFNTSGAFGTSADLTWDGTTISATNLSTGDIAATGTLGVSGVGTFSSTVSATSVSDGIGNLRTIPISPKAADYTLIASDAGTVIAPTTGSITVPNSVFSAGQTVTIFNNAGTTRSVVQGAGVTMRLAGTATTGTRIMDQYGIVTLVCITPSIFVIAGAGLN